MNPWNARLAAALAVPAFIGWLATGCAFDPSGLPFPGEDPTLADAMSGAPDGAITCEPGCEGNSLRVCEPEEALTACPLGCNAAARACFERLTPSNGAGVAHPLEVSAALVVPAGMRGTIDTDTGAITIDGQETRPAQTNAIVEGIGFYLLSNNISVVSVTGFAVEEAASLRATGSRALVILSVGDALIQGIIDVSAGCADERLAHCAGPGGGNGATSTTESAAGCAPGGNGAGESGAAVDETGGGGGGLGTGGAPGGDGGNRPGGLGGVIAAGQCPGPDLRPLRGGSGGGAGGIDSTGGDGGGGGGAIQITSFTRIAITGRAGAPTAGIDASGAGGRGGEVSDGGGGGGAGGAILLEAPSIELRGVVLAANGGGGGGGGSRQITDRGERGVLGAEQARGGGSNNQQGGLGASVQGPATAGAGGGDNTGGGGGGAGIIRLNVPESGLIIEDTVISPSHTRGDPAGTE